MAYTGTSIVDYLKSVGQTSDYNSRATLAASKGIQNYTGTAEQNTQLLRVLNTATPQVVPITYPVSIPPTAKTPLGSSAYTNKLLGGNYFPTPITTSIPPDTTITPDLPPEKAHFTLDTYYTSLSSEVDTARKTLEDTYKKQVADLQVQQAVAQKKIDEFTAKQETIIGSGGKVEELTAPFRANLEKTERERLKVEENFFANQTLTNELGSLLTEGNTLIQQMKGVTGLSSIRDPRVNKTISDISARAGVIQAVMTARNNQITVANNLIDRTVTAMTADRIDQLSYYNTLYDFYNDQKTTEGVKLITITSDQKDVLKAQIAMLENDLKTTQTNADNLKTAITDPDTALAYASSGVTLNDTPEQINQKLAQYAYSKEVSDTSNKMALDGASYLIPGQTPPAGSQVITTTDSKGVTKQWYIPAEKTTSQTEVRSINGREILIDSKTGNTIKDLGPSTKTSDTTIVQDFQKSLVDRTELDKAGNREQFIRQLIVKYPQIDEGSIAEYVYGTYPDGYNK